VSALTQIGSVAGLVGTAHGRLLLAKVAVLAPILVLGAINRTRLLPALSGPGATVGRPAMRRLAGFVVVETVLALVILALASAMTVTPPARHQQPAWPFPYRLSLDVLATAPALGTRVFLASQLAVLGGVALLAALLVTRRRAAVLAAGAVLVGAGVTLGVPPLAVDAYPTTYRRPAAPYHAISIASGMAVYREHCAGCHGLAGDGDGPGARGLPRPPANLRSPHTRQHTAGDLFWWITRGFPASGMPGFGGRLTDEQRWDVINFVRALA
jgi:putative copper resistance protein D